MGNHPEHSKYRQRLLSEQDAIKTARNESQDSRAVVKLDQDTQGRLSRMDAMERQAMAKATDARRALRLQQIAAALNRLDEDEYGYCQDCGDAIAPERLDAEPCVLKCGDCAKA